MDFQLPPEAQSLQQKVRRSVETVLAPIARQAGESYEVNPDLVRAMADEGILQQLYPRAYGGAVDGMPPTLHLCLIREELSRGCPEADLIFAIQGLGGYPILLGGSEEQKQAYLPAIARGEALAAFAMTEPEAGSDVASLQTTARREGDEYVLSGEKIFISNGCAAHTLVVFAKTDPEGGHRGISAFIVDGDTPGLERRLVKTLSPHDTAHLIFDGCRIPASRRLGEEGEGFKLAMNTLNVFRASVGGQAVGMAQAALDAALEYAMRRQQFGRPLSDFQAIQFKLADMATELDAARLLVYRAAWKRDATGEPAAREASMAKLFATEMAHRAVNHAVQIFGGLGVTKGTVVERLYRDVRAPLIYEGTSEIQRIIIARDLLKTAARAKGE